MGILAKFIRIGAAVLLFCGVVWAQSVAGTWVFSVPGPDGTSRDTYFRLKESGGVVSGVVQQGFNVRNIDAGGTVQGTHVKFSTTFEGRGGGNQTQTYEGDLTGGELHLKSSGGGGGRGMGPGGPGGPPPGGMGSGGAPGGAPGAGGGRGRGPQEITAMRTKDDAGMPPARIEPPALHDVKYNGLAKTPPMGWNSWNHFRGQIDDAGVRSIADAMVANGMKAAGYEYVNIDDTWQLSRDAAGNITANKRFPDMKALADYVHSKGLKIGIYSSPGPKTCANYEGSYGHEVQDAKQFAAWGIDYLKYDWCSAPAVYQDSDMHAVYQKMGDALAASGRAIVFSLCQYGRADVQEWGPKVSGNLWRTTGDISDSWKSMSTIGFSQNDLAKWAAPGHWNDPDMLEVGNGGMTQDEYRTHMTLWSVLAAPLLAGNDIRTMNDETKAILTNKEIIALDQDKAGHQGRRVAQTGDTETWVKELADGSVAVALFNKGDAEASMTAAWKDFGIDKAKKVRDLWSHSDLTGVAQAFTAKVPSHGVVVLRVSR